MIARRLVFEIHRLAEEGLSIRKIAAALGISRDSAAKYLRDPVPAKAPSTRKSKLDPFKNEIARLLDIDPNASAVVIRQRLMDKGFEGGVTIVKDYLRQVRPKPFKRQAYLRFESNPGEQMQIDWGHFGSLPYGGAKRKLYCLAVLECHSRLLYLEFTHSQKQEALHQGILNAFRFFKGSPKDLVVDNMVTAVIERQGPLIRFNDAFLEFCRSFKIRPYACHKGQPHEKGKVENVIKYIRYNFWPLRTFKNLEDVNGQAADWRDHTANVRTHETTGQRPVERFDDQALRSLEKLLPDYRETAAVKVHKDFAIRFDANAYTVDPAFVGKMVAVKADSKTVSIYDKDQLIAKHARTFEKKKRIESPKHAKAVKKRLAAHWQRREKAAFAGLGPEAENYLKKLAASGRSIRKSVKKLNHLMDEYGRGSVLEAIQRAQIHQAFGADYIENILYQEMTPSRKQPPLKLQDERLNQIRLDEPCLADYDAFIIKRRKKSD